MRPKTILCSILILICLGGCARKDAIEGTVQDVFGNPLKDVTVSVEKSTFTSVTDNSGKYVLDYAPGMIKLTFSKDGYTTAGLDLNIQQKVHYPAELTVLYPIPKDSGIFYVDIDKKQLVKLEPVCEVEEKRTRDPGESVLRHTYSGTCSDSLLTIEPGEAQFIDKAGLQISIFTVNENGAVYEGYLNPYYRRDIYSGFLQDSISQLGKERLLVRTVDLAAGSYVWIEMRKLQHIGAIPNKGGSAISFKVEGSGTN